jgi:DNA-binding MarR family transcriptional regulator
MADIYDIETYQPRKGIGYLINRVRSEMLTAIDRALDSDERLGPMGLSSAQFIVIAQLATADTAKSASDLCKGISYDAGAMTRMLDRLESKGLIQRSRCSNDRRLVHLELTEAGRAVFPRMREISMTVANRFLRGFTRAEARQLEGLLERMLQNAVAEDEACVTQ